MKKERIPRFKIGEHVNGRIVIDRMLGMNKAGRIDIIYEYRYEGEPENISPLNCSESTLIRYSK